MCGQFGQATCGMGPAAWDLHTHARMTATSLVQNLSDQIAARLASHAPPLEPAIDAERRSMTTHRGQALTYYVDRHHHGQRPIVLFHSVNACASSYEMRPLFQHYRGRRPVYALDLPGFGLSAREARPYTTELFVDSIRDFLGRVHSQDGPADVVALSLSGEFAAEVAATHKDLFHSLTLISPTGFGDARRHIRALNRVKAAIQQPLIGWALFELIATRPSVRYFLQRSFVGAPDAGLTDYAYATSHQPGAYRAPIAFLAGDLSADRPREDLYPRVRVPVMVVHDVDGYTSFEALPAFVARHPSWHAQRIAPTRGMPQFEAKAELGRALDDFWSRSAHPH